MTRSSVISSQLLLKYELRVTTSVARSLNVLARDIDAHWAPQPDVMIADAMRQWQSRLQVILFQWGEQIARESVTHIFKKIPRKNEAVDLVMMGIRYRLRDYSTQKARLIEEYLKGRVLEAVNGGATVAEARSLVRAIITNKAYAERIARTESHHFLERGLYEAANSVGARMTKRWISREDSAVRPAHAAAHGQVREISEPFTVGGEQMMYPGDSRASGRNTVNCRCTVDYQLR